jgi:5-methylcytosine-specific restriction endonuclease McrBC GTP-binding regulatory subunit McrB
MEKSLQKIYFGSPGVGKSYKVNQFIKQLYSSDDVSHQNELIKKNVFRTVFHPEYTYADFMGKILPYTKDSKVTYSFYSGDFFKALVRSYQNMIENPSNPTPVVFSIEEINRGNSSAIFGSIFSLLDRDENGISVYPVLLSDFHANQLLEAFGFNKKDEDGNYIKKNNNGWQTVKPKLLFEQLPVEYDENQQSISIAIRLPANLYIWATMNTSDQSVFYMDSAFKRRWEWEYVSIKPLQIATTLNLQLNDDDWKKWIDRLNLWIKSNAGVIRGIEDKQVGYHFITERPVINQLFIHKLMFFVWDTIFPRNKAPIVELLKIDPKNLVTFGDFMEKHDQFFKAIDLRQ